MKKTYLLCLALLPLLFSCKKDKDDSNSYHVSFKLDGQAKSYTAFTAGTVTKSDEETSVAIAGTSSATNGEDHFAIALFTQEDPKATTYTDNVDNYMLAGLFSPSASIEYQAGTILNTEAGSSDIIIKNHFKVTITSIDDKSIRGTFSGDFYLDGDPSKEKKTITDGSFYVPVVKPG